MSKIIDTKKIQSVIESERKLGKTIVTVNGCFDMIHVGHIRYLRAAKEIGDILVALVNTDESIKKIKGPKRPIMSFEDRVKILEGMEMIDYIVGFDEPTAENILKIICPDVQAKGTDYTLDTVPEKHLLGKYVKKIAIVGDKKDHSTKDIIKEILAKYK